jgi:hypothetical protein
VEKNAPHNSMPAAIIAAVIRWMEQKQYAPKDSTAQLYAELPRRDMQLVTTRLEKRPSFHGNLQSKYSHSRPPQRLLVKILTRDVTSCLDDTIFF